ncbi:MAG: tRNA lysidine(34) synthetase TilS [Gammaproteobacteria bacterium]
MAFSTNYLRRKLPSLPTKVNRYLVGFSGGLDSHVLLHCLNELQLDGGVTAIHVNHSINDKSEQWQSHCEEVAKDLNVAFLTETVDANPPQGESPEAWARLKRYEVFSKFMREGDLLLLAHHQDDQIETFFLQLLRGSGPLGLSAMQPLTPFSEGWIARPLLEVSRIALEVFAQENQLQWIDDPSNQEIIHDRNFLRHEILPMINKRWPGYKTSLSRSILLQSESSNLLLEMAEEDLKSIYINENTNDLSISNLRQIDDPRMRNLLRLWIRKAGFSLPSHKKLEQIVDSVIFAADDRSPCVDWNGAEVRRYLNRLMIMTPVIVFDREICLAWDLNMPMLLPSGKTLTATKTNDRGIKINTDVVDIRFRQGGEVLKLQSKKHSITLKKYLQEQKVLPWLRNQIPLIYVDDQLIAVSDLCTMDGFVASSDEEGWAITLSDE